MNRIIRKINKRAICSVIITTVLTIALYNGTVMKSTASTSYSETDISTHSEDISDLDVDSMNSTTEIVSNETIIVQESVVEENNAAVVEVENIVMLSSAAHSEFVQSEVEISDEEKWKAISYSYEPYTMFVDVDSSLNVRTEAVTGRDNVVGGLHYGDQVTIVGYNTYDQSWSAIEYRGGIAFVCNDYLKEWVDLSLRKDTSYINPEWDGETKLNARNGRIEGPSGQETYYNLPMDRCIYYMNLLGYNYEVWVRDDGVKMFGDYIMIAANLETRPKGSLVETSLGTGIVVDTGEFVNWNPNGIDIAVTW